MPASPLTFIYLDVGRPKSPHLKRHDSSINLEIQYSLSTLLSERPRDFRVIIYTDKIDTYSSYPILVEDVDLLPTALKEWSYIYRAKPCVLLHALRKYNGPCVFLDSDTYLQAGSVRAIGSAVEQGALLWARHDDKGVLLQENSASPPHGNSGVIGLSPDRGEAVLEDALEIIDRTLATGVWARTLEQSAICEAIWRHGLPLSYAAPWVIHYWANSKKRYMHSQIKRLIKTHGEPLPPARPSIRLTPARVKLYQYYWDVKRTAQLAAPLLSIKTVRSA
jgi:hypothetical protein